MYFRIVYRQKIGINFLTLHGAHARAWLCPEQTGARVISITTDSNTVARLARADVNMDPSPASYYGPLGKSNPVLSAFQSDLKEFKAHIKQLSCSPNDDYRSYSRG